MADHETTEGGRHAPRQHLDPVADVAPVDTRRQAVDQLLDLTDDELLAVLGDVLRGRARSRTLTASTGCVPVQPVEAHTPPPPSPFEGGGGGDGAPPRMPTPPAQPQADPSMWTDLTRPGRRRGVLLRLLDLIGRPA